MSTQVLQAMVEAMVAEIKRQGEIERLVAPPMIDAVPLPSGRHAPSVFIQGAVNLELVARAGLEAIKEPSSEMSTAGKHAIKGCDSTFERDLAETAYRVMIDAILWEDRR